MMAPPPPPPPPPFSSARKTVAEIRSIFDKARFYKPVKRMKKLNWEKVYVMCRFIHRSLMHFIHCRVQCYILHYVFAINFLQFVYVMCHSQYRHLNAVQRGNQLFGMRQEKRE